MLRNILFIRTNVLLSRKYLSTLKPPASLLVPNEKTSVLITNLSLSTTETSLKDSLKDIKCRKMEIEPGCSLHFLSESGAHSSAQLINDKLSYKVNIGSATVPCLILKNIPERTSVESLRNTFALFEPKTISILGGMTVNVVVKEAHNAVEVAAAIEKVESGGQKLQTSTVKLTGDKYSIKVFNIAPGLSLTEAEKIVLSAVAANPALDVETVSCSPPAARTVSLRFNLEAGKDTDKITEVLRSVQVDGKNLEVSAPVTNLRRPAIQVRNAGHVEEHGLRELFAAHSPEHVLMARESKNKMQGATVYFSTEKAALKCLSVLKGVSMDGKVLSMSYRPLAEPAVTVKNLPQGATEQDVRDFMRAFDVSEVRLNDSERSATALLSTERHAKLAYEALNRKVLLGQKVSVEVSSIHDIGFTVTLPVGIEASSEAVEDAILRALQTAGVRPQSVTHESNVSAFLGYMHSSEAFAAQSSVLKGSTVLPTDGGADAAKSSSGAVVSSTVSVAPSFVLQVLGLGAGTPASEVVSALATESPLVEVVKVDRSALVKFLRHKDVVPGMKAIKTAGVDGQPVRVERYRVLSGPGDTDYDKEGDKQLLGALDRFSLKTVLKDYLQSDPATRWQIARNYFERALFDAKAVADIHYILDSNASPAAKAEVEELLRVVSSSSSGASSGKQEVTDAVKDEVKAASQRLFELFLQREDMRKFAGDFRELGAFLGAANENDPFDWSQFSADNEDTLEKLKTEAQRLQQENTDRMLNALRGKQGRSAVVDEELVIDLDAEDEGEEFDDEEQEQRAADRSRDSRNKGANDKDGDEDDEDDEGKSKKRSVRIKFNADQLTDSDGNIWSGVILDTDMVQKTTPGQRVLSHRALVCIGNLRGAAGYGMGKAANPGDALTSAFRAALRNLVHIDLYDNFGLAHDCHGKHNSCQAYIRATPRARVMVGSSFATEVLTRFGIGSCSVKLVGRRDPYAMVMALFDAVKQHENIDEFAKDRGKRFITLKWAYNNSV